MFEIAYLETNRKSDEKRSLIPHRKSDEIMYNKARHFDLVDILDIAVVARGNDQLTFLT